MTVNTGDLMAIFAVIGLIVSVVRWSSRLEERLDGRLKHLEERLADLKERHNRLRDDFVGYVGGPTRAYHHRRLPSSEEE